MIKMNWLDIVILVAIAIPTIIGLRVGIIKAAFSLAGLIAGIVLAGWYYIPLSEKLSFISPLSLAKIAAFAIILIGVIVVAAMLAWLLRRVTSIMMLGSVDKVGGAILGFVLGALLCGALLAAYANFLGEAKIIKESQVATILIDCFSMVLPLFLNQLNTISSFSITPGVNILL